MINKISENVIRGNDCYTLIQVLSPDFRHNNEEGLIREIIESPHHFWQGDRFPNGFTWTHTDQNGRNLEFKDVKTFGFYDNDEVRPENYVLVDWEEFEGRLTSYILQGLRTRTMKLK